MKVKITKRQLSALRLLVSQALENTCSCVNKSRGHSASCWVSIYRHEYSAAYQFFESINNLRLGVSAPQRQDSVTRPFTVQRPASFKSKGQSK